MPALFVPWLTMAALMTAALIHAFKKRPVRFRLTSDGLLLRLGEGSDLPAARGHGL
jgi:hypothetical protein